MRYDVIITQGAIDDLASMDACWRSALKRALREFLVFEPRKESKSRIKRLRLLRRPQYRLRVAHIRVFYDVSDEYHRVEVLGFVPKTSTGDWLEQHGVKDENALDD